MGFNGARKHEKLEDPRYLYWADRLGLLVWGEMPGVYRSTKSSLERVTRECLDAIDRDYSHPCVIACVPFNGSSGVPNLPESPSERHDVQALYHLTKGWTRRGPSSATTGGPSSPSGTLDCSRSCGRSRSSPASAIRSSPTATRNQRAALRGSDAEGSP